MTHVNIVICSKDRFDKCFKLVREIEYQVYRDNLSECIKIIIIENGSKKRVSRMYTNLGYGSSLISCLNMKFSGLSYARNTAVAVTGLKDYIYFLDDDISIENEFFVRDLIRIVNKEVPDILGGPVHSKLPQQFPRWLQKNALERDYGQSGFGAIRLSGGNFGFNKLIIESKEPFDQRLGMQGKKIRVGEEKDFVEKYLATKVSPKIYYAKRLKVSEEFDSLKLGFLYRVRREFAIGYASHANHEHEITKRFYGSLGNLDVRDIRKAFRFAKKSLPEVYAKLKSSDYNYFVPIFVLSLSRTIGLFLRKLRWQI